MLEVLLMLARHKRVMLGVPLAAILVAIVYSLILPNIYTASTRILPPQQNQSAAAALLSQIGGAAPLLGAASGIKNPNELYIGMLKSRTVADNLIQRFGLMQIYEVKLASDARKRLEADTNIATGKDGIITVDVDQKDAKLAAEIANGYIDELMKLTRMLAVTEASQRRLFFEHQLQQAKSSLTKAEVAARRGLQAGGLVKVDEQGRAMVETTARLRAQMSLKEVQIGAMRTFAGESNPELRLAQQELESIKRELAKIEGAAGGAASDTPAGGQGLRNLGLLRDLRYNETLYELLAKQFELAKIDEAKDSAVIQVLDRAIEPDRKSKPKRSMIVLLFAAAGTFAALLWVSISESILRSSADPEQAERLRLLRRHLSLR